MKQHIEKKSMYVLIAGITIFALGSLASPSFAAVMESNNYRIQQDSVNVGGIDDASSASYNLKDTVGEVGTGPSDSTSYKLKAGYRQMNETSITISSPSDVSLTALSTSQDSAVGSATWTVTTDNPAGYTLDVKASTDPALRDTGTGENFADYSESTPGTKETWQVSNAYEFGFSGFGDDTTGYGADTNCINTADVPSATLLWEGFEGTTNIEIASSTDRTSTSGTNTTLCIATEQDSVFAPSGTYTADITATAIAQ